MTAPTPQHLQDLALDLQVELQKLEHLVEGLASLGPVAVDPLRVDAAALRLHGVVQAMSKWSMADVFAVGMLIALLVGRGTANLSAVAGPGFYWFTAYCLVSNAAFQLLRVEPPARGPLAP